MPRFNRHSLFGYGCGGNLELVSQPRLNKKTGEFQRVNARYVYSIVRS